MSVYYVTGWKTQKEYFAHMNAKDFNHNARTPARRNFYSLTPASKQFKGRLFVGNKKKQACTRPCVVVSFLVFFIILSVAMTSLFLWQINRTTTRGKASPATQKSRQENGAGCVGLPKPVELKTLPKQLRTDLKTIEHSISKKMAGKNGDHNGIGALTANLVYRDKVIWSSAFGVLNRSENLPRQTTSSTVFPCASISKVITALAMYKLYNDKLIKSLNEPITNFDPDFKINNPFNNHQLSLMDLVSMRSGIQREAPCYPSNSDNFCPYSHKIMIDRIQNLSLLVEPNTLSQYSNLGFALLGQVLAKRFSRGNFHDLADKYVLKPLKMDQTTFSLQKSQVQDIPLAYNKFGQKMPLSDWGWLNPAGGMFSTVNDLAKLEIDLMQDRYLSRAITDELFSTMHILPDGKSMTGTPWEMNVQDGIVYREKGGAVFGYNALMALVPELRLSFNVMCTNCALTYQDIAKESFEKLIVPTMTKELRKFYRQKIILPPNHQVYVGNYSTDDVPSLGILNVDVRNNKLLLLLNSHPMFYLNYTSVRRFRISVILEETGDCLNAYTIASENDRVIFDQISSRDGLSHGFVLFDAHPNGRSYFHRLPRSNL